MIRQNISFLCSVIARYLNGNLNDKEKMSNVLPKKIQVIKLPRPESSEVKEVKDINDTRMPRMYLELLENKDKIKPNLVNREYDPDEAESVYSFTTETQKPSSSKENEMAMDPIDEDDEDDDFSFNDEEKDEEDEEDEEEDEDDDEGDEEEEEEEEEEEITDTQRKLQEMLFSEEGASTEPPTLAQLQQRGEVRRNQVMPTFDTALNQEEEDEMKRELLFKFEILKKKYKHASIPDFSVHSDLTSMQRTYDNTVRHISLESSVDNYKNLLIGGFMLFEFILGVWLKFDMSGFTQQQILNMNQYDRLLIELGEKSYVPEGKQWPVEIRLLGLIVMNAIIFIISKLILQKTGANLMGMMNNIPSVRQENEQPKKRKMRGPDFSNIPEINDDTNFSL